MPTGKHLCQNLFLNKVTARRPASLLKKRLWRRCFPLNFVLTEQLRWLLPGYDNNQAASNMPTQHSKNEEMVPSSIRGHQRNEEIISVIGFIEETMKKPFQSDPIGKVVNISKKTVKKETFQLLNKNLNFVPTPKVYNKAQAE